MKRKIYSVAAIFFAVLVFASCSESVQKNVNVSTLKNGLTLYTVENHSVPLVYIEIAVRAGAVTQTKDNAGLFHLYEHMMFKGNELYPTSADVQKAIKNLGVADWNGTTGTDCVNYFFTIPSNQLENGLEFWNAAIRFPLMDETELENEKKVVLSEIKGDAAEPLRIASDYKNFLMYPDAPFKTDPAGSPEVVANATVSQLKEIQNTFYIPSNAALFVGGDIDSKEVKKLAEKIYGTWQNPESETSALEKFAAEELNSAPFSEPHFCVVTSDTISPQITQVSVSFRGPDSDFDLHETYAADLLSFLMEEPSNAYRTVLSDKPELQIPHTDYLSEGYATRRKTGEFYFSAVMMNPEDNIPERAKLYLETLKNEALPALLNDADYFSKDKVSSIVQGVHDNNILSSQTSSGFLSTLRFWWTCATSEYYFGYEKNLLKVKQKDVQTVAEKYLLSSNPIVMVFVHPSVYENLKSQFDAEGFIKTDAENSFWWKEEQFAPSQNVSGAPKTELTTEDASGACEVSLATENASASPKTSLSSEDTSGVREMPVSPQKKNRSGKKNQPVKHELKNGIPIYIQKTSSDVVSVYVGIRGGVLNLTKETSGLEQCLLEMLTSSSISYDYDTRRALGFKTKSSTGVFTKLSGSAVNLTCISSYMDEVLPVFLDGIMNPSYEEKVFDMLKTSKTQSVQNMLNDTSSRLSYYATMELYKNHPYSVCTYVTPDSLESVTIENMKSHYEKIMDASNIFVVAVGNVNEKNLLTSLNKTLGTLTASGNVKDTSSVPPVNVEGDGKVYVQPSAGSSGHIVRYFTAPSNSSEDYIPAVLASDIYSTLLFSLVREHYGICYTPRSGIVGSHAALGSEYLYRVSNFADYKNALSEARTLMLEDRLIDSVAPDGSFVYTTVENVLEGSKNSYVNSNYAGNETCSGEAAALTYNLLQFNDINYSEKILERVENVSAEEVCAVFKKYWADQKGRWFAVVGPENQSLDLNN